MAGDRFRVGLVQLRTGRDIDDNLGQVEAFIREAAAKGAHYIQTPENTNIMEVNSRHLLEKIDREEATRAVVLFAGLARELRIWLHIGSLAVKIAESRAANRAYLFAPDGALMLRYDKIHMFDVSLPGGESYRESATFAPGVRAMLAQLPWGGFGVTTCYDMRFPEQYKALAQAGAAFLTAPSAFTKVTGEAHWHVLLRARAIENGCFMFAAAQGGRHASGRETYGHSIVVSPWGDVLAEGGTEPGVILADIDVGEVARVRGRIPSLDHARPFEVEVVPMPQLAFLEEAR